MVFLHKTLLSIVASRDFSAIAKILVLYWFVGNHHVFNFDGNIARMCYHTSKTCTILALCDFVTIHTYNVKKSVYSIPGMCTKVTSEQVHEICVLACWLL